MIRFWVGLDVKRACHIALTLLVSDQRKGGTKGKSWEREGHFRKKTCIWNCRSRWRNISEWEHSG